MARNTDNLIPFTSEQSREKAKENGRKGGIASGVAKREKRTLKEILEEIGNQIIESKNGEKHTKKEVACLQQYNKAINGDLNAFLALAKIQGELTEKIDATTNGKDIVSEPIRIEVIDKREQVRKEEA